MPARKTITLADGYRAMKLSGIELPRTSAKRWSTGANRNLARYDEMRKIHIPERRLAAVPFQPASRPGIEVNSTKQPFR